MNIKRFLLRTLIVVMAALSSSNFSAAQEIKVDFNFNGKPLTQTADPLYTPWNSIANGFWFPSGANSISNTFSGITFTFARVGSVGTECQNSLEMSP